MRIVWCLLLVVCCVWRVQGVTGDQHEVAAEEDAGLHARQAWIKTEKDLKATFNKIIRKAFPTVMKEVYKKELSTTCLSTLLHFANALKQSKAWAFQMVDSSGRFPEGFLSGTLTSLGNYEECVRIRVNENKVHLKGQYCQIKISPPLPNWKPFTTMHGAVPELRNISAPDSALTYLMDFIHNLHVTSLDIGVCTPSLCSLEDLDKLVKIIPEKLGIMVPFSVKHCETQESVHFTQPQIAVLCFMAFMAAAVVLGSVADVLWREEDMEKDSLKAKLFYVARAFSFVSNVRKLSDYTVPHEPLTFAYGLVFFSFFWATGANTFMYVNYETTSNMFTVFEYLQQFIYEVVLNRVIAIQILFFISGLTTTYRWLKSPEQHLNVWKFLLKRYLRFTPAYAFILALMVITPTWGSGPTWNSHMQPIYNNCKNNWWYNLLYINNYMESDKVCLDHTWVFAVDAQLHVLAVFILIPLKLRPKIGLMINFMFGVASLASVALTNVYYDLPPNEALAFLHEKDRHFYGEHSYYRVYSNAGIYCSGVFVAYFMHKYPNLKISKKMKWALWITTLAGIWAAMLSVHAWRSGVLPSALEGAIYATFSKIAQAAMLSWVSVTCMTGNAGALKDLLCWRPFIFLSRLVFIAYTMHVPLIIMVSAFKKTHMYIAHIVFIYNFLSHVTASLIVSYILHVCVESPVLALADILRKRCMAQTLQEPTMTEKPMKYNEKNPPITDSWRGSCEKSNC